jgi:hypothetical protein
MKRESVKLMSPVKERIELLKRELKVKTESEAIAYLYLYHDSHFEKVTVKESKELLESVKNMHLQESIYLNEIKNRK